MHVFPECQPSTPVMGDGKAYFFLPLYVTVHPSQQLLMSHWTEMNILICLVKKLLVSKAHSYAHRRLAGKIIPG